MPPVEEILQENVQLKAELTLYRLRKNVIISEINGIGHAQWLAKLPS